MKGSNMKLPLLIGLMAVLVGTAGCGGMQRDIASMSGKPSETCHEGVKYLQFTSGATVQVDATGKPVPC